MQLNLRYISISISSLLVLVTYLLATPTFAQNAYLEVTNLKTNKVKKLKERKRITVFTEDQKIRGPLQIIDSETISINNIQIKLSDVIEIKNKTIFNKIVSFVFIPVVAVTTIGILAITGSSGNELNTMAWATLGITTLVMVSKKKYKTERYKFRISYE